jgi:hypothetical protein
MKRPTKSDEVFDLMVLCAINNERCPFNDQLPPGALSSLARAGKVRIEVFRHNWRIVTILEGPHAGKQTLRDPLLEKGARPYVVIDGATGPRRLDIPPQNRRDPWKPGTPKPVKVIS